MRLEGVRRGEEGEGPADHRFHFLRHAKRQTLFCATRSSGADSCFGNLSGTKLSIKYVCDALAAANGCVDELSGRCGKFAWGAS